MSRPRNHPDPTIDTEIYADILEGHVSTLRATLETVLDLDLATPKGQWVKDAARHALASTDLKDPRNCSV